MLGDTGEPEIEKAVERPQRRRDRLGPWRSLVLSLLPLVAISFAIWYLQSGLALPLVGGPAGGSISNDAAFVSLESQGIELGASGGPAPKIGEPAPDFALPDVDANVVRLSDFRGKTVVMNAWATWCPPCREEFPELVNLYDANKDRGLVVLGVDLQESPGQVQQFAEEFGAKFPIVIDLDAEVAGQYRLLGLPTTWFIDAQGILRAQQVGVLSKRIIAEKLNETGFQVSTGP